MTAQPKTLLDFLMRDANWMSDLEAAEFDSTIAKDRIQSLSWNRFQGVADSLTSNSDPLNLLPESGEARVDSQLISAYLEGTLEPPRAERLERLAWQRPNLMRELIFHFRNHYAEGERPLVPERLTLRLLQATRDWELAGDQPAEPIFANASTTGVPVESPSPPVARPLVIPLANDFPTEFPMAVSIASQSAARLDRRRRVARRKWLAVMSAATALLLILAAGIWAYNNFPRDDSQEIAVNSLPAPAKEAQSPFKLPEPEIEPELPSQDPPPKFVLLAPAEDNDEASDAVQSAPKLVDMDEPKSENLAVEPGNLSSKPTDPVEDIQDLEWGQIEGLLALRSRNNMKWYGPKAKPKVSNGLEWQTLPNSWAQVRLGNLGEIVMAADSAASVDVHPQNRLIEVDIQHGALGLRKLSRDTTIRIRYGDVTWQLETKMDDTVMGVDWMDDRPRVFLRKGLANLANYELKFNQQAVMAVDGRLDVTPLRGKTPWMERPQRKLELPKGTQEELLASQDLVSDIQGLATIPEDSKLHMAQYLPAVLDPEASLMGGLEGADAGMRKQLLNWLASLPPNQPRTRLIWRTLASSSGAPDYARQFFRMMQLAKAKASISKEDAELLVNGLKHDRMFVRQVSQAFLEAGFGNPVHYQADGPDRERNRAADNWGREILQRYVRQNSTR